MVVACTIIARNDVAHAWPMDIGLEAAEAQRLAALYDLTELATALKPRLRQSRRAATSHVVVDLDPGRNEPLALLPSSGFDRP